MQFSVSKDSQVSHFIKCSYVDLLGLYVDQNLKETEMFKIRNHLKICSSCHKQAKSLQRANEFLTENIPKKRLSDVALNSIQSEVIELIKLQPKMISHSAQFPKNVLKDFWVSMTSLTSLRIYVVALAIFYVFRLMNS